ncbi:MAG TPA: thioredoxin domain-containing protein [Actinomycetes bacterium]|nr:thioredoxin domain-containing protein [Actinomycetes bacterium]
MTNRLGESASPYLQQHAENPVEWWPWGPEPFAEAERRGVPVLLSVGYAACHWCHVMAHESFEDPDIARVMNERFVAIKVDREERPDVDAVYMDAVTAMTGQGGWPMTVFLTPDGQPFYAGTYFPPRSRGQMPGFTEVLIAVSETWRERADDVRKQAADVLGRIASLREQQPTGDVVPDEQDVQAALDALSRQYDFARGGFGSAPKFPPSMVLEFLVRRYARTGNPDALLLAEGTMRAMAGGGIYDQLGGGFARYSVDADWVVPHFEKMLYDNALLARVALHLGQVSGRELGRRVALETADFMLRDLLTAQGGFASALDADTEGEEGKYYVWTQKELLAELGEDGEWACNLLGVTDEGTFEHGSSTLQMRAAPDDPERWLRVRQKLLAARAERTPPARDDKVVAVWNGLAISALAEIGMVHDRPDLVDAARRCGELLWRVHWTGDHLLRVSRDGVAGQARGVLEDYAGVAEGWLTLFQVTGEVEWYERALRLLDVALSSFAGGNGTFFDTAADAESLVRRPQEWTDNATPCGQSLLAGVALTAAAISGEPRYRSVVEGLLTAAKPYLGAAARFAGWWLAVTEAWIDGPREVAVVGPPGPARDALVKAAWSWPAPGRVVVVSDAPDERVGLLRDRVTDRARAWVCRDFRCELPTDDADVLRTQLGEVVRS